MVFKERTFYGKAPEEILEQVPEDLETRVANCLYAVDGLDASDVTVVARGNTILLTGSVATPAEVERAEEAAHSIEGVDEVVNQIIVPEVRSPSASS